MIKLSESEKVAFGLALEKLLWGIGGQVSLAFFIFCYPNNIISIF